MGQPSTVYSAFLGGYPLFLSISLIAKVHFEFALKGEKHDWQGGGHEPGPFQVCVHIGGIRLLLRTKANTNVMYESLISALQCLFVTPRNCSFKLGPHAHFTDRKTEVK